MSPNKIVITGTIASGKSTLINLIKEKGYIVISADEVNKNLLEFGKANYEAIKSSSEFDQAFDEDKLDKMKLAKIIFSNKEKLIKLNSLTHRNILDEIDQRVNKSDKDVVFIEIPLYFQMEEKYKADEVWLVVADIEKQISRLMTRDGIDSDYAKSKIETQIDLIRMKSEADVVFDNSNSISELKTQLEKVLKNKDLLWKY